MLGARHRLRFLVFQLSEKNSEVVEKKRVLTAMEVSHALQVINRHELADPGTLTLPNDVFVVLSTQPVNLRYSIALTTMGMVLSTGS